MGEKPGKVQALGMEFSADCAAIRAKSGEGGYAEPVDTWIKGVYTAYTQSRSIRLTTFKKPPNAVSINKDQA